MQTLLFTTVALLVGMLLPVQASFNAQLGQLLKHPFYGTVSNFATGLIALVILMLAVRPALPTTQQLASVPAYCYAGGLIGACFVTVVVILVPKIGVANTLLAAVVGQLLISVLIDHFGWLDVPEIPVSFTRLTGSLLLIAGLYLIQKPA